MFIELNAKEKQIIINALQSHNRYLEEELFANKSNDTNKLIQMELNAVTELLIELNK